MDWYGFIKALHIVSIISWMAGLLYLPRLFVYHSDAGRMSATSELFKIMEYKLYKFIMNPALISTWITGAYLAIVSGIYLNMWFVLKLILVILMSFLHLVLGWHVWKFRFDGNTRSSKFFRIINEVPTVIMIAVVFLVVLKPGM